MPLTGIEPVRILLRGILSLLCLPIPPQRHTNLIVRISSCCGTRHLRRRKRLPHLPTAATRSGRSSRHWRRSPRSPLCLPIPPQRRILAFVNISFSCNGIIVPHFSWAVKRGNYAVFSYLLKTILIFSGYLPNYANLYTYFFRRIGKFSKTSCKFPKNDVK